MNLNLSRSWRLVRIVLVPVLLLSAATGWLVIDGLRMRSLQLSKYALPADHSPQAMLEFIRKLDGSKERSESYFESSNFESVGKAVLKAHEILRLDQDGLTIEEKHEADFYYVNYSAASIMQGHVSDVNQEVNNLLNASKKFVTTATAFSAREQGVALLTIQVLDSLARIDEAREFGNWLLEQINQRPEFSSDAAKTTSQKLTKIVQRLSLMNEILELQSRTVDDLPFDLGSLRGKVILLEFWGTHCKPCIADFPALKRIYSANQDRGFEIVAVSLHAAPARIKSFTEEYQLPWLQLCNDKTAGSECNQELADRFGIQAVPTTLLLDTEGRVVAMGLRPLASSPEHDLEKWLTKLLPWRPESMK